MHVYHLDSYETQEEAGRKRRAITAALGLPTNSSDDAINDAARSCYAKFDKLNIFRTPLTCGMGDKLMEDIHHAFLNKAKGKVNTAEYNELVISWKKLIRLYLAFKQNHKNLPENYKDYDQEFPRGCGPTGCGRLVLNYAIDRVNYENKLQPGIRGPLRNSFENLYQLLQSYKNANPNENSTEFLTEQEGFYMQHVNMLMEAYKECDTEVTKRKIHNLLFPVLLFLLTENYFTKINEKLFEYFERLPKADEYWLDIPVNEAQYLQRERGGLKPAPDPGTELIPRNTGAETCCCRIV